MECNTTEGAKMNEPKINQIGRAVIVEFEFQEEAEAFYKSLKKASQIARILTEDENSSR